MTSWWRSLPIASISLMPNVASCLTDFRAPCRRLRRLTDCSAERGLKLDAVIELKVDEGILLQRIEKRIADMTARGEKIRSDDNPEVLKGRLFAYREQTAPLVGYYASKGLLETRGWDGRG